MRIAVMATGALSGYFGGRLAAAGLAPAPIEALRDKAERRAGGVPREGRAGSIGRAGKGRIVAVAEYRDGTVIDVIERVKEWGGRGGGLMTA